MTAGPRPIPCILSPSIQGPQYLSSQNPAIPSPTSCRFLGAQAPSHRLLGDPEPGAPSLPPPPGPKRLDSWEGNKGVRADWPEAGHPRPSPSVASTQSSIVGSEYSPPTTPTTSLRNSLCPSAEGAKAGPGRRAPGRPHGSQPRGCAGPHPQPWDPTPAPASRPIVHCATKLPLSPGRGGRPWLSPAGPLSTSPVRPDSGEPEEEASRVQDSPHPAPLLPTPTPKHTRCCPLRSGRGGGISFPDTPQVRSVRGGSSAPRPAPRGGCYPSQAGGCAQSWLSVNGESSRALLLSLLRVSQKKALGSQGFVGLTLHSACRWGHVAWKSCPSLSLSLPLSRLGVTAPNPAR